jgi:hypothetical protein
MPALQFFVGLQVFQDICLPGKGKINSLKNEKITQMGII